MKNTLTLIFTIFLGLTTFSQTKSKCSILDGRVDTLNCDGKKLQIEFSFCESSKIYYDGIVTDLNGKEEFCFFYKYDKNNKLKSVTFWNFQWSNNGYTTKDKLGQLKINGGNEKLFLKNGFTLSKDFIKFVTKI